jgi:phenylpyruvate tautomerase PptA (4-oxalocrotonate tautomerase family)
MPFVNIRIYEGWDKPRLDEIAKRVTEAITDVTKLPKEAVWVWSRRSIRRSGTSPASPANG